MSTLQTTLIGTLIGLALFGGIFLIMPQPVAPLLAAIANQESSYAAEIELLREETASLRRELQELNLRMGSVGSGSLKREPLDGFVSQNDFDALAKKLGEQTTLGSSDKELEVKVEETLQEIRRKENDERTARRTQERIAKASEWLGFDVAQQDLYEEMIYEEQRDERELSELWQSGSLTAEEGGRMKGEHRRRHLDNVASMLNPQQLETFNNAFGEQRRVPED
jgi:hypothetical protein